MISTAGDACFLSLFGCSRCRHPVLPIQSCPVPCFVHEEIETNEVEEKLRSLMVKNVKVAR